jgi:hypothetical protein
MAKLYPSKETFVDLGNGKTVLVSNIKLKTTTSDHVDIPLADDVQLLQAAYRTSDPTFYLTSNQNQVAIDSGTVGTEYILVSRHSGMINYGDNSKAESTS